MHSAALPFGPEFDAIVQRLYFRDVIGEEVDPREGLAMLAPWKPSIVIGVLLLFLVVTAPLGLYIFYRYWRQSRRAPQLQAQMQPLVTGRVRRLYPVMVNSAFLAGSIGAAPGVFIGAADEGPDPDPILISKLALAAMDGPGTNPRLAALIEDLEFVQHRRRRIPADLSAGRELYFFDVPLHREDLDPTLEFPVIEALVEPGPGGHLMVIPARVIKDACTIWDGGEVPPPAATRA
jgi:hypothetical protein